MSQNKNNEKPLTPSSMDDKNKLSDFDICELYIKCVQVFVETSSKLDISRGTAFDLGNKLWRETVETLKNYRESNR